MFYRWRNWGNLSKVTWSMCRKASILTQAAWLQWNITFLVPFFIIGMCGVFTMSTSCSMLFPSRGGAKFPSSGVWPGLKTSCPMNRIKRKRLGRKRCWASCSSVSLLDHLLLGQLAALPWASLWRGLCSEEPWPSVSRCVKVPFWKQILSPGQGETPD